MYMYHTLSKPATMEACQDFYSTPPPTAIQHFYTSQRSSFRHTIRYTVHETGM